MKREGNNKTTPEEKAVISASYLRFARIQALIAAGFVITGFALDIFATGGLLTFMKLIAPVAIGVGGGLALLAALDNFLSIPGVRA